MGHAATSASARHIELSEAEFRLLQRLFYD